jgi:small subunit ribosomal protein S17
MKNFIGQVIATKMNKTATVLVKTQYQHPLYKKTLKRVKKYLVHDEIGVKKDQKVLITKSRPISKKKHFKIKKIIEK